MPIFDRRFLYLCPSHLAAFHWEAGALVGEGLFETSADGHRRFAAYLAQHTKSVFSLLINAAEEGFQIETLPFLRGANRKAIIQRKLGQLFFDAPLSASFSLGHEKSRRKNERVLLAALTGNDFFQPWMAALHEAQAALSGVYSLPFLGSVLFEKLKITDEHCLLLTMQDRSLRQSYFHKGQLHFSRLTPLQDSSLGGIAQSFAREAHKLQQYLASQRRMVSKQAIVVHLLAQASARTAIESICIDTPTLQFKILNREDCAKNFGMRAQPADSRCETLFLHLLASTAPRTQFADDEQRHHYHLGWLRHALYGLGGLMLFCSLLLAGKLALDTVDIQQEAEQLALQTSDARQRYASIAQNFPALPASHETLRRIAERYAELQNDSATPNAIYRDISRALNVISAVRLDGIDWTSGPLHATGAHAAPPANFGDAREIAIVRGTVQVGGQANPRRVLVIFNAFLDALKSNPRLRIVVLQAPVDLESGQLTQGVGSAQNTTPDNDQAHRFNIQIGRK